MEATPFREVVDLALFLSRQREWTWRDDNGMSAAPIAAPRAAARLARELLWSAPRAFWHHQKQIHRLRTERVEHAAWRSPSRGLFLRTDHDFGLVAGGSVGHLAGVIHGFRNAGINLEVVSSDWLVGVPRGQGFHRVLPRYAPVRNVPDLPVLHYNRQLIHYLSRKWSVWRPDFVYQRYSLHNYTGAALRARFAVAFVCEYNGSFPWMVRNWEGRRLHFERTATKIELLNLHSADLVVVVSDSMAAEVAGRGVAAEKILVNPNGVDPDVYAPAVSGDEVRSRYGLEGKMVVGFIGTFGPWHGASKLVEAAARLKEANDPVHFLLIGDGLQMDEVRRLVRDHRLGGRVTLTGRVPQAEGPAHLAACDILASPHVPNPDGSPFFGSPTKLFEYMAMARAIVASDLEQIGSILEHGETAWLVPPGDADALAQAISHLVADPELRRRLGTRAREVAIAHHTWDAHSRRILQALGDRMAGRTVSAVGVG